MGFSGARGLIVLGVPLGGGGEDVLAFTTNPTSSPETITLTRVTPAQDMVVQWGDGDSETILNGNTGTTPHQYLTAGSYVIAFGEGYAGITWLDLNATKLSGSIPAEIGNLTQLQALQLRTNQLTGPIPAGIGNCTQLQYLQLYGNQLTGSIPAEIGNCAQLRTLYLLGNQLTGVESGALQAASLRDVRVYSNAWSAAVVGDAIDDVWAYRASYTYATPVLQIHGTNAAPTGNVVAPPGGGASDSDWSWNGSTYDPLTTGAKIWDLAHDVNGEGFNTWTITYTGGSVP